MSTCEEPPAEGAKSYHHGNLRDELLARAVEVVGADGVEALSLRSLARDLGVSHAAPARHFRTKNELLTAIASDGIERLIAATDAAVAASEPDPVERIKAMARAYLRWAVEHPAHHTALRNPEVMRFAGDGLKYRLVEFAAQQRSAIETAKAVGWKVSVPTNVLMFQLVATLAGSAILLSDPTYRDVLAGISHADLIDQTVDLIAGHDGGALGSTSVSVGVGDRGL